MRIAPVAAAIPILLLLLTWLSFRAINRDAELFDHALGALDRFAVIESALQRDVLSARVGVLRNYDPLVRETQDLDSSLLQLREASVVDPGAAATLARLAASIVSQQTLVEQFKSNNALLQNSLAYFGLYSTRLSAPDQAGSIVPVTSGLAAAMLHLTLDTSPAVAREVETRLEELAERPLPAASDHANSVQALLAHGRLLLHLLPETDGMLKAMRSAAQRQDREALRTMVLARQSASRATARSFRLLLYITSLLLVALLVYLGMQLRARALALQRRSAFEHAIAGISTRFIDAGTGAIDAHVTRALAELAARIGADRAYFVLARPPNQRHIWSREGVVFPPAWPEQAPTLAARFPLTPEGVIHVSVVDRLPEGQDKATLVAAGLDGWVCVPETGKDGERAVLGFDAVRPGGMAHSLELGLLHMAFDAVNNAVRRDALEQEGARLEQRLQQSRRMETVGALTSGIAHNFNNIIAAILGYTEIAEAQVASDSQPARDIAEIRHAGERARDLVEQILAFGRRRDSRRKPVCVIDLVTEAASLLRVSLPPDIDLVVHDASGNAALFGERGQLQQVVLNLCNNAAQAMDGAGRIKLELALREIAQTRPLSHGDLAPGRYVCLAVADSGRGMDEATLSRIFEPFFTTRLAGNGLGLATVREIVREHGGAMNVQSAPRAGSRFEAWLPCASTSERASTEASPMLPLGHGETVLVIDEEREQLLKDEEILAALGYEPVGFTRADDGLAACRHAPERFDFLVVGYLAQAASRLEFATKLHAAAPNLPILLAGTLAKDISTYALVGAGISDVVHRPIIATEIAAALAACAAPKRSDGTTRNDPERERYA
jgi:signal transduction histidine kinase